MPAVVQIPTGPFASGTTPLYTALLQDNRGNPAPGSFLDSLTLSIVNTLTGEIINSVDKVDVLNTGRGQLDEAGNLSIQLEVGDTSLDSTPGTLQIQRSLILDYSYAGGSLVGRHQVNFILSALAGP